MAVERLELESRPPLTVDEFEALAVAEGWDEDTRVELLDGEVVWMSPVNDRHIGCVNRLNQLFHLRYGAGLVLVSIQNPVRVGDVDLPQPDVVLLSPRADFYSTRKATPADVQLLIEVSDTTLRIDLGRKARIYAAAEVREYWVADVNNRVLYVHRGPSTGRYTSRDVLSVQDHVRALFAPEVHFSVAELLI